ncbi:hypothetical protein HELRODRAFT_180596 [Helobdella robusta]|uniref:Uncharacterized protein n=1 Tax=Helobdella robusta TaxID=6412 RepID=T1FG29_HELRO|nr:hypothetical protein HELRODRAFT_180596 [Helobdella robusta]ESN93730.1 hypothetical protein HELRODRAFT_180596 [Helobdella robusta]
MESLLTESSSFSSSSASSSSSPSLLSSLPQRNDDDGDEVIKVPHEIMGFPLGFVIDAGCSAVKVLYRSLEDYKDGKLLKPSDSGLLHLRYFNMEDVEKIIDFLKNNCDVISTGNGSECDRVTWYMTGLTTQYIKKDLEENFEIKCYLFSETAALKRALSDLDTLNLGTYDCQLSAVEYVREYIKMLFVAIKQWEATGENAFSWAKDNEAGKAAAAASAAADSGGKNNSENGGTCGRKGDGKKEGEDENVDEEPRAIASGPDGDEDGEGTTKRETVDNGQNDQPTSDGNVCPVVQLITESDLQGWADKYLKPTDRRLATPSLILLFGSSAKFLMLDEKLKMRTVGHMPMSGKTLCGLAEELLGEKDFDKFMKMAEDGDAERVNTMAGDLRCEDHKDEDWYAAFPDNLHVFDLGKLSSGTANGKGKYSRNDLAAGLLSYQCKMIGKFAYLNSRALNVEDVYICGSPLRYQLARKMVETSFFLDSFTNCLIKGRITRLHFIQHPGFLVGLGLWLTNLDLYDESKQRQ